MNLFTFTGDMLHLASILILLMKIYTEKNCRGISMKTQFLYALVFVCRYLDLFWNFHSMYNWVMKCVFISTSFGILYLMMFKRPICTTYEKSEDSFRLAALVVPAFVLALLVHDFWSVSEILWTFSIYLEAVAIVPQLFLVHKRAHQQNGFVENLTSHYVFTLGGYRAMYLVNWLYRYLTEPGYRNWIVWVAGIVQTAIYMDFFYYYTRAWREGKNMQLPI